MAEDSVHSNSDIAVIGMAVRVPRALSLGRFWENLAGGVECISSFSDQELLEAGVAEEMLRKPEYVKRGGVLEEMACFDAEFFGFSPKEAAIMDPQHRHFLECSWEALEDAGHPPEGFDGPIGVYAGCGMNGYFMFNLLTNPDLVDSVGLFLLRHTGNDKDFLSTRLSYLLNLTGPSINIQNACSTSMVAIHAACQSLLSGECDMALAGGVTIEIPHRQGYVYHEGEVLAPDGYCRAFDHRAQGTVFGSGVGVVVLRRLDDAIGDRDHMYAVIKGSTVNNDGSGKVGYLAPSVDGQAAAVTEALAIADVGADTIDYVECHGTGTSMGDPIEIAALTRAYRTMTDRTGYCRIGSVKTNIGHLDTAAGVVSFVKAALALKHREIPPSLNFEAPNPQIDFENSPFRVCERLTHWERGDHPRRAGVNSLGVGGTNAHVILEEAPELSQGESSRRPYQLLQVSARNRAVLDDGARRLADFLETNEVDLADVAFTLQKGRRAFDVRRVLAAANRHEAAALLRSGDPTRVFTHKYTGTTAQPVFMFPGGGAQYPRMGFDLYHHEPVYREHMDRGMTALRELTGVDFSRLILAEEDELEASAAELCKTSRQLPAIFIVEYALARLWMSLGVTPVAMIGHSLGENTAACLAGVLSFDDCLRLVVLRGELVERAPVGAMLSVELAADGLAALLGDDLDLASINSPQVCVASGTVAAIERLEKTLAEREVECRRLHISVPGHSRLLDPVLGEFRDFLRSISLSPPTIPFISNGTGTWITREQATDAEYWVSHLRNTVRFTDGVATLLETSDRVLIEVGPGRALSSLARQRPEANAEHGMISSLRHADESISDAAYFQTVVGRLWSLGVEIDLDAYWSGEVRQRIPLPTYAFRRQEFWIEPGRTRHESPSADLYPNKLPNVDEWFWKRVWRSSTPERAEPVDQHETWLLFLDHGGIGDELADRLRGEGESVITVRVGDTFFKRSESDYVLSPEHGREGYDFLVRDLIASGTVPTRLVHLWLLTTEERFRAGSNFFHRNLEQGFFSLFFLAQALSAEGYPSPLHIDVVTSGMQQVNDEALPYPEKATVLGPCKVIPRELSGMTCRCIDVTVADRTRRRRRRGRPRGDVVDELQRELSVAPANAIVAYRDGRRFVESLERVSAGTPGEVTSRIRDGGVYLVTGGLGGLGFVMAESIARAARVKLILLSRSALPDRAEWDRLDLESRNGSPVSRKIRSVRKLESYGAEVLVASADVTDIEAMREVVHEVERRFGPINGVVHAAGTVDDDLIAVKNQADIDRVFSPKIQGTMVLEEVLGDAALDFFVLFSSTSTAIAPAGQVDYVGANAFLNAFARSRAARSAIAINWGVWNEVGMAARAVDASSAVPDPADGEGEPARHPLLDTGHRTKRGDMIFSARYGPESHWIFDEHRSGEGLALMPGTGFIELARACLAEMGEPTSFELRDLYFFYPLTVADGEQVDVRITLHPTEAGYTFEVESRPESGNGDWRLHSQASLVLSALGEPEAVDMDAVRSRCASRHFADPDGIRTSQEDHVRFGPRWRVLQKAHYGQREALGELCLPKRFRDDLSSYAIHPSMLDYATGFALPLATEDEADSHLWVPVSYGSIRIYRPMTGRIRSWVRLCEQRAESDELAMFDVTVLDDEDRVVAEVRGYTMKRVAAGFNFTDSGMDGRASRPSASVAPATQQPRQQSPAELALEHNVRQGILPAEGAEAFERVLNGDFGPEVIVSSMDLDALLKQTERLSAQSEGAESKFARPELDTEYVAPHDDIERTLVLFWEELLGVDKVGVQDSFFDLGGHSLIAVRLFAKIKKAFDADYPISILFQSPTIERVAALIRESGSLAGDAESSGRTVTHTSRYRYLVAMHPGDGGRKTPFFLVAGMFGNVLNLRHLAYLVGTDRPFYGIQARGLYGDETPHETFDEMAAAYLEEVRRVQAHGPYLLGGFSGGGITAFEMAQRLVSEGEEVGLLAMLDSLLPQSAEILRRSDKVRIHWQRLCRGRSKYIAEWIRNKIRWKRQQRKKQADGQSQGEDPALFRSAAIEDAFRAALPQYQMRHYPGTLILFRPKLDEAHVLGGGRIVNVHREFVHPDNGWGKYADRVEVFEVPGDHDSMVLEPNVRVLARRLAETIHGSESEKVITKSVNNADQGSAHAVTSMYR